MSRHSVDLVQRQSLTQSGRNADISPRRKVAHHGICGFYFRKPYYQQRLDLQPSIWLRLPRNWSADSLRWGLH